MTIYLNLSGEYVIPKDGKPTEVGSINGDLRLASLDAFLHSIQTAVSNETTTKFEKALSVVIDRCSKGSLGKSGLTLVISSKLDAKANEMTYSFNIHED